MKRNLSVAGLGIWRAGVCLGIGVILFLQKNYIGHREFDASITRIDHRLDRIERKLDTIHFGADWRLSPIAYGPTNNFRLTPLK